MDSAAFATGATDSVSDASSEHNIVAGVSYAFSTAKVGAAYSRVDGYGPTENASISLSATQPPGSDGESRKFDSYGIHGKILVHADC